MSGARRRNGANRLREESVRERTRGASRERRCRHVSRWYGARSQNRKAGGALCDGAQLREPVSPSFGLYGAVGGVLSDGGAVPSLSVGGALSGGGSSSPWAGEGSALRGVRSISPPKTATESGSSETVDHPSCMARDHRSDLTETALPLLCGFSASDRPRCL